MFPTRDRFFAELPRWLVNLPGSQVWAVVAAIGEELERVAYLSRITWQSWLIVNQPVDALKFSGELRKLPRYSLDTDQSYRNRIWQALEFYKFLGTSKSIVDTFALLGYTAEVICEKDWTPETKPDEIEMWNRFWVRVEGFEVESWNQPLKTWNEPTEVWNASFDGALLEEMRQIVLRCRFAGNLFVGFIFVQPGGSEVFVILNDE